MGELQTTVEFSVELGKFVNVDLFQRGFYQIRTYLKLSPKIPSKVEVNLPKNSCCDLVFPACVVNGTAVSKTFQILYKDEEVVLNDLIVFKVHLLLDGQRIHGILVKAEFQLVVELWFTDQNFGPDQHNSIECVSTRTLDLHFDPARGLHHHLPVLFEYFYLSAINVTIHASLLALCQPYLSLQRQPRAQWLGSPRPTTKKLVNPSSLETVLFGPTSSRAPSAARLQRGKLVHWELCRLLLSTYNSLRRKLIEYLKLLPPWHQLQVEAIDSAVHLENLSDFSKECYKFVKNKSNHVMASSHDQLTDLKMCVETEEDFLVLANSDVAQLCGALIVLWQQFLEVVVHQDRIQQHLALEHHQQRVRHFSEAFFIIEKPRNSALTCDDSSYQNYMDVTEALRRSQYLNLLPPVEVECVELDGDLSSLPIIYEEHYQELARRSSHNSHCSYNKEKSSNTSLLPDRVDSSKAVDKQQDFQNVFSLPSSPSVLSWSSEPIPSPVTKAQICFPPRKTSCGEKLLTNLNHEEYTICGSSKKGPKMNFRSKVKLKTKTSNLLKQLKRPHFSSSSNSVVLLGFKKLDFGKGFSANNVRPLRASFPLDGGIRHSQSTLSVSSESELRFPITSSESMPDLTVIIPPPPPPPKARYCAFETNAKSTNFLSQSLSISPSAIYKPPLRQRSETTSSNSLFPPVDKSFHLEKNSSPHTSSPNKFSVAISHKLSSTASADNLKTYTSNFRGKEPQNSSAKQSGQISKHVKKTFGKFSGTKKATSTDEGIEKKRSISQSDVKEFISFDTLEQESTTFEPLHHENEETSNQGNPPSPPVEFKDPPGFLDKSKSENDLLDDKEEKLLKPASSTDTLGTSDVVRSKIFSAPRSESFLLNLDTQGTVFFPKPPALFSEGHCSQKKTKSQSQKETVSSSVKNLNVPVPSSVNGSARASVRNASNKQAPPLPQKSVSLSSRDNSMPPTLPPKPAKFSIGPLADTHHSGTKSKDHLEKNGCQQKVGKPEGGKTKLSTTDLGRQRQSSSGLSYLETKCTILEMLTDFSETHQCNGVARKSGIISFKSQTGEAHKGESKTASTSAEEDPPSFRRASVVGMEMISFVKAKEEFRQHLNQPWLWYSDFPTYASDVPYFQYDHDLKAFSTEGIHLIVCVHGLDGNSADLRLFRTYLELGLPNVNFEFLMSERNQGETFGDFEVMTDRLVSEITYHIEVYGLVPTKISFIGHSLGNIIIRSALTRPEMKPFLDNLHTFLSLSGPHLGTLYNSSGLVNMGMWFMQKWKKSGSLLQLGMKDAADLRETFLYKLSKKSGLEHFKNVLLFGSSQDRYVTSHSARIELCKSAVRDTSVQGAVYREMVKNILQPIVDKPDVNLVRYDVHHALPSNPNSLIGRTAHIALLDSELFIEKFLVVCGLKYFS